MIAVLLVVIVSLVLYVAYLQIRLSSPPQRTVVLFPDEVEPNSNAGCATTVLLFVAAVVVLAALASVVSAG